MATVGCGGVLVADTFCGPMQRLPAAGELMVVDTMLPEAGGCAANVAIDLAHQGISVDVVGCLGRDASARIVTEGLEASGVGCSQVVYSDHFPTSKTVILIVAGEDRRYIHTFGANQAFTVADVQRDWVAGLRVLYIGGFLLLPAFATEPFADLLRFCRDHGVTTVVDVVTPRHVAGLAGVAPLLPLIDWFLPNDDEAGALTGRQAPTEQLACLRDAGANGVVITCGPHGLVAAAHGQAWQAPAFAMEVVDPSGAGDAFSSGLIVGLLQNWDLRRTLAYASAVGGSAVRAVGTTPGVFGPAEADAFLAEHPWALSPLRLP